MTTAHPDYVGTYRENGEDRFFPVAQKELDRTAVALAQTIRSFGIPQGRHVLTISLTREFVQFAPFERALTILGIIGMNADASRFDAPRVEAIIRQFDVAAICGLTSEILEGLAELGFNPADLLAGRIVWARPDAWDRVNAMPGVIARRYVEFGPALALECAEGRGVHLDSREWILDDRGPTLALHARMARITAVRDLDTGVRGRIVDEPCRCGIVDPLVLVAGD